MNLSRLRINKTMEGRKKVEKRWREDERGRMIERRETREEDERKDERKEKRIRQKKRRAKEKTKERSAAEVPRSL